MPAGKMTFQVTLYMKGVEQFGYLKDRINDPTPLWHNIINMWARGNVDKFLSSLGMEGSGAWIDQRSGVFWRGLTPAYMRSKRRKGFGDQIMVATGALRSSLTTRGRFFEMIEKERIIFGTPNDPDDVMKVLYNWESRQTIFLSAADMTRIQNLTFQFLQFPGSGNWEMKRSVAQMDIDFQEAVANE